MKILILPLALWAAALGQNVYSVRGVVVHSVTGKPVAKATVWVAKPEAEQTRVASMVTGSDGRFELPGLAAGSYALIAERLGFVHQHYGSHNILHGLSSAIILGPETDPGELRFALLPASVIAGHVRRAGGEPAIGISVAAFLLNGTGASRRARPLHRVSTDDRGYYRLHSLPAGTYAVAAWGARPYEVAKASGERDMVYPPSWYPESAEPAGAGEVKVAPGEEVRADIHVRLAPANAVSMKLPKAVLDPPPVAWLTTPGHFGSDLGNSGRALVRAGIAYFGDQPPGIYRLRVMQGGSLTLDQLVRVSEGEASIEIPYAPLCSVRAQVSVHGGLPLQAGTTGVTFERAESAESFGVAIDANGSALLNGLPAGKYILRVIGARPLAILSVEPRGARVVAGYLEAPSTGEVGLSIIVDGTSAVQKGFVYRDGRPTAGLLAILVPKDRIEDVGAYRFDQSDSDGSFNWYGVAKGEFWAVAVDEGVELDYMDPAAIRPLLERAKAVTVGEGRREPVRVDFVPPKKSP